MDNVGSMFAFLEKLKRVTGEHGMAGQSRMFQQALEPFESLKRKIQGPMAGVEQMLATMKPDTALERFGVRDFTARLDALPGVGRFAALDGHKLFGSFFDMQERLADLVKPTGLAAIEGILSRSVLPSLTALNALAPLERKLAVLYAEPLLHHLGVLAWATPGEEEPSIATVVGTSLAPEPPTIPAQRLHIEVDVRCSRCGSPLAVGGSDYRLTTVDSGDLHFDVIPFCKCLYEWDGTREDLLKTVKPGPALEIIEGGAEGSGEPGGKDVLRLVSKVQSDEPEE